MADIRVKVNQGFYDEDLKKLLVIRDNAITYGKLSIQDAVEQRLKKCYPEIYQRKVGQLHKRHRDSRFKCYCNYPKTLEAVCKDILYNQVPYDALHCEDCWREDLATTWGYYGYCSKVISKEVWRELCADSSYAKYV
ncbi:TPA: hypothetical protein NJ539_004501 [Vibrio parahaemolyticus]|nr:hypothetical protein [Vibrio parahaemolyticus]